MNLREFDSTHFSRGRNWGVQASWLLASTLVESAIPGSSWRAALLRAFGATIGKRVTIKPGVKVKFPWRLRVGSDTWIGEKAWIDNLVDVSVGSNCCISQGVYVCTGNHDWSSPSFDLRTSGVVIADCVWLAAMTVVGPGVAVGEGAVLVIGSVARSDLNSWTVYAGNPATPVSSRRVRDA